MFYVLLKAYRFDRSFPWCFTKKIFPLFEEYAFLVAAVDDLTAVSSHPLKRLILL